MEKSGTQRRKKTIWTKMAISTKPQGLKWQFTQEIQMCITGQNGSMLRWVGLKLTPQTLFIQSL
ncbi:hypothetical protein Hanom_Chr10g00939371 [Helianthus anomalus]